MHKHSSLHLPNKQNDTKAPNINFFGIGTQSFGCKYFWRNIQWGTTQGLHNTLRVHKLWKAKVRHFYDGFTHLIWQQNIFRLEENTHFLVKKELWAHITEIANIIKVTIICSSECYTAHHHKPQTFHQDQLLIWKWTFTDKWVHKWISLIILSM